LYTQTSWDNHKHNTHTHIHTYIHTHTYTHTHTYIHTYILEVGKEFGFDAQYLLSKPLRSVRVMKTHTRVNTYDGKSTLVYTYTRTYAMMERERKKERKRERERERDRQRERERKRERERERDSGSVWMHTCLIVIKFFRDFDILRPSMWRCPECKK